MYERFSDTHVDQSEVVLIDGELLRADVFLQSRGIGALKGNTHQTLTWGFSPAHQSQPQKALLSLLSP